MYCTHCISSDEESGRMYVTCNRWEGNHGGDLVVDGWIVLGWISRRCGCGYMDWIGLAQDRDRWRTLCECVNEPLGSVKCGEFPGHLASQ